jgi:hypothetical protein
MGNSHSRTQGIQRLHTSSATYRVIAVSFQCSHTAIARAIHSDIPSYPAIKRGRKKLITPEISRLGETLSLMDVLLSNAQIKAKVQERWPDLKIGKTSIRHPQSNHGFKFRLPMIKEHLLPEQRFQRHQFRLGMLARILILPG